MANTISFSMIGKINEGKSSDKFQPYSTKVSEKGWVTEQLSFNCLSGTNRHMLNIKGGHFENGGKIFTFTKGSTDEKGNKIKGEKLEVKWEDRNKQEIIDKVAEFKKFIIDLEKPNRRYKLKQLVEKVGNENITYNQLKEVGIELDEELSSKELEKLLKDELEKSQSKRKEFISECDYAKYIHKLIESGKVKDSVFNIKGNIEYSEYNGKVYKSLVPSRIYLANKDDEQVATADYTVYYNKYSLDSMSLEEKDKYFLNAYIRVYDNNRKKEIGIPVTLTLNANSNDEKKNKIAKFMAEKIFTVEDDSWKETGLQTKLLNGAQKMEITEDMLSDVQKEMLELEMITMEEIAKEMGEVYGSKVEEIVITKLMKGYSKTGFNDTVFTDDDFIIKDVSLDDEEESTVSEESDEDDDLPFDLDIDLD